MPRKRGGAPETPGIPPQPDATPPKSKGTRRARDKGRRPNATLRPKGRAPMTAAKRLKEIGEAVALGWVDIALVNHLHDRWEGLSHRRVRAWVKRWWDGIKAAPAPTPEEYRHGIKVQLQEVHRLAVTPDGEGKRHLQAATSALKALALVTGVAAPIRHEVSGAGGKPIELGVNLREEAAKGLRNLTPEQLEIYLALLDRMREPSP